jgi:hypothetical protein
MEHQWRKSDLDPNFRKDILELGPECFSLAAFDQTGRFHHYLTSHYSSTRQEAEQKLDIWKKKRGLI